MYLLNVFLRWPCHVWLLWFDSSSFSPMNPTSTLSASQRWGWGSTWGWTTPPSGLSTFSRSVTMSRVLKIWLICPNNVLAAGKPLGFFVEIKETRHIFVTSGANEVIHYAECFWKAQNGEYFALWLWFLSAREVLQGLFLKFCYIC